MSLIYPCNYLYGGETRLLTCEADLDKMFDERCEANAMSTAIRFNGGKPWKGQPMVSVPKSRRERRAEAVGIALIAFPAGNSTDLKEEE